MTHPIIEAANRIAAKANECCNRSDGFQEAIQKFAWQEIMALPWALRPTGCPDDPIARAYDRGRFDQRVEDDLRSPAGRSQASE